MTVPEKALEGGANYTNPFTENEEKIDEAH